MSRFGMFVDAGYLYAASGTLLYGASDRRNLVLNSDSMLGALVRLGADNCRLEHLRTYWYDGARDAVPTPQQVEIGNLPGVKLRLGRLTSYGQKGVDSRIVRDLITLSYHGAIATAYLLGGDEDLREGVSEAQERGVRVILVGVEPLNEQNLSPTLAMEADDVLVLDREFIQPHFRQSAGEALSVAPGDIHDPRELGRTFARSWAERTTPAERGALLERHPRSIPPDIDRILLSYGVNALGIPRLDDEPRRELRKGFWDGLSGLDQDTA